MLPTTRPEYINAYGATGLGIVPRRGIDNYTQFFLERAGANPTQGVMYWSLTAPNRLLKYLHTAHEYFALARSNDLALGFAPGDTNVVAVGDDKDLRGRNIIDGNATAVLDADLPRLFAPYGGLLGFQHLCYDAFAWGGASPVEIVPGVRGHGLLAVYPFDPLTCLFATDPAGGYILKQNQGGQPQALDPQWCRYNALWPDRDNPYGKPKLAQALTPGLRDIANQRRADDAFDTAVWPQKWANFPLQTLYQFALESLKDPLNSGMFTDKDGKQLSATDWALAQFDAFAKVLAGQSQEKTFIKLEGAELGILSGAEALRNLSDPLKAQRFRLYASLDQLPAMMGETDGGTQAYAVSQYNITRHKLETVRHIVNGIVEWVASEHLRLLGLPFRARADVRPMAPLDALAEQQARAIERTNVLGDYVVGLIDSDTVGEVLHGHAPVDVNKLDANAALIVKAAAAPPPKPGPEPTPPVGAA